MFQDYFLKCTSYFCTRLKLNRRQVLFKTLFTPSCCSAWTCIKSFHSRALLLLQPTYYENFIAVIFPPGRRNVSRSGQKDRLEKTVSKKSWHFEHFEQSGSFLKKKKKRILLNLDIADHRGDPCSTRPIPACSLHLRAESCWMELFY